MLFNNYANIDTRIYVHNITLLYHRSLSHVVDMHSMANATFTTLSDTGWGGPGAISTRCEAFTYRKASTYIPISSENTE